MASKSLPAGARQAPAGMASRCHAWVQAGLRSRWAKPLWWMGSLGPLAFWVWGIWHDALGANPAEYLIRASGDWTLRALCLLLAITPLREWTGWSGLARFRRLAGLFVFFYGSLHLLAYAWFDMGWDWGDIVADLRKRPFILVGFLTWLTMVPLASTSFHAAVRWLGGVRWRLLHRLAYVLAPLALLHFFWMRSGKHNYAEVAVYGAILAVLLLWRLRRRVMASVR